MIKKLIGLTLAFTFCFQGVLGANAQETTNESKMNFLEYVIECITESVKKAYDLYEEAKDVKQIPKTAEDIVNVCDVRSAVLNGDDFYLITYCMNGVLQEEPLVVEYDCQVSGIKSDMKELACGDMIIIDTNFDETVDYIRVVMSLNDINTETSFKEQISVPEKAAWYLYGTKNNAKNEVYFGYITKTSFSDGKLKLSMCDETGRLANAEMFNIEDTVKVSFYNAYKNDSSDRFEKAEIYDIEASVFPDKDGDIDFESEEFFKEDMKYAFIYVKRGEIKEIVLVNYSK